MKILGKFSDKHKRLMVVAGCSVLCVALVVVIGAKFQGNAQGNDAITSSSSTSSTVLPSPDSGTAATSAEEQNVTVQANQPASSAVNSQPAQTDQSTQDLQPKVSKPAAPAESEAKNPSKPPSSSVGSNSSTTSTPKAGDTQNGKVYIPGFGWVTNNGGGGSGTTASDMYEDGNKVGQMD
jgi:hypothetical protein